MNYIKEIFLDFTEWLWIRIHIKRAIKEAEEGKTVGWREFFRKLEEEENDQKKGRAK